MIQYRARSDCERVMLSALAGADNSLAGLKWHGCSVLLIPLCDYVEMLGSTAPVGAEYVFRELALNNGVFCIDASEKIVVLETVFGGCNSVLPGAFTSALKLFKAIDVYHFHFLSYRIVDGRLKYGGVGKTNAGYPHAPAPSKNLYKMTEDEKRLFPLWLDKYKRDIFYSSEQNKVFQGLLNNYELSYRVALPSSSYMTLMKALEALFTSGQQWKKARKLSRGVAKLLSSTVEEYTIIQKEIERMYDLRSRDTHEGIDVNYSEVPALQEYVRRVIMELIELGYHKKEADIDTFRNEYTDKLFEA